MALVPTSLMRQSDVVPMDILDTPICVIGAGAIGSWTVLSLAKMGFSDITVWDHDNVDDVNLCGQLYGQEDIGKPKVERLHLLIKRLAGVDIKIRNQKWEGQGLLGVVITAVDSMAVRRQVFETMKGKSFSTRLVIDPRMAIETALLYTYKPLNMEQCEAYSKSLYSDEAAVQDRCTAKVTMYTALMISGLVSRTVKNFLAVEPYAKSTNWNIKTDDLKTFWREA